MRVNLVQWVCAAAVMLAVAFPWGSLAAQNTKAPAVPKKQQRGVELKKERFRKAYKYIILGNEQDLEYNKKAADFMKRKAEAAAGSTREKAEELLELLKEIIAANEAVLAAFEEGSVAKAKKAMEPIPTLELDIRRGLPKYRPRPWLTMQEMQGYFETGYEFRVDERGVLPYARKQWNLDKKPKARRKKAPEADDTKKATSSPRTGTRSGTGTRKP